MIEKIIIGIIVAFFSTVGTFLLSRATIVNKKADVTWVIQQDSEIRKEMHDADLQLKKDVLDQLKTQNEYLEKIIELKFDNVSINKLPKKINP